MNFEQILPLITETSSTIVLISLFVWSFIRLPKQISEGMAEALKNNNEDVKELTKAVLKQSEALDKLAERQVATNMEVHKLAVLTYAALASKEELKRVIEEDQAIMNRS